LEKQREIDVLQRRAVKEQNYEAYSILESNYCQKRDTGIKLTEIIKQT